MYSTEDIVHVKGALRCNDISSTFLHVDDIVTVDQGTPLTLLTAKTIRVIEEDTNDDSQFSFPEILKRVTTYGIHTLKTYFTTLVNS